MGPLITVTMSMVSVTSPNQVTGDGDHDSSLCQSLKFSEFSELSAFQYAWECLVRRTNCSVFIIRWNRTPSGCYTTSKVTVTYSKMSWGQQFLVHATIWLKVNLVKSRQETSHGTFS